MTTLQAEVIEDDEDEDGGDSDLEDGAAQENGAKNDVDLKGAETTVLSLVSQREAALRQFKVQGSVQQSRLSSQFVFQCWNLPQLLNTQKNVQFHLILHINVQF